MAQQDLAHVPRRGAIAREIGRHEHGVGTEPLGARRRHRRAHAERARLVRGCANDRALAAPRHDDRPSAQRWIVALLDGGVERIHVDVDDLAHVVGWRCGARDSKCSAARTSNRRRALRRRFRTRRDALQRSSAFSRAARMCTVDLAEFFLMQTNPSQPVMTAILGALLTCATLGAAPHCARAIRCTSAAMPTARSRSRIMRARTRGGIRDRASRRRRRSRHRRIMVAIHAMRIAPSRRRARACANATKQFRTSAGQRTASFSIATVRVPAGSQPESAGSRQARPRRRVRDVRRDVASAAAQRGLPQDRRGRLDRPRRSRARRERVDLRSQSRPRSVPLRLTARRRMRDPRTPMYDGRRAV